MDGTASPPPTEIPASSASLTDESTHSSYDASSLTLENSKGVLYRSVSGRLDECTRWTNEKHNLYLNRLEASFLEQMHKSITLNSRYQEQNKVKRSLSQKLPAKMGRVSKQLTVVRDCRWQNINIKNDLVDLDTAAISHCSFKDQRVFPFSHSDIQMQGFTEGSDQNFVDEDHKEKTSKRTNASIGGISIHDQIVQFGKFENPTASSSTLGRYNQASPQQSTRSREL